MTGSKVQAKWLVPAVLTSVLAAGCAGEAPSADTGGVSESPVTSGELEPTVSATSARASARKLQSMMQFDIYSIARDPLELAKTADVVAWGTVEAVREGRLEGDPNDGPWRNVVVAMKVDKAVKAGAGDIVDGRLYLELHRPDDVSAADYQQLLPAGMRLFVFAENYDRGAFDEVSNQFAGRPEGTHLFLPNPQGFFIGDEARMFPALLDHQDLKGVGWPGVATLGDLTRAVQPLAQR